MTLLLSETEKKKISTAEKTKKFWEQGKYITRRVSSFNIDGKSKEHIDWGGSCYGMSTWACLTKDGVRKISELGSTAENLHSVEFSPQVESAINFYQGQQDFRSSILARNQFMTLSQNEQLEQLESQLYDNKVSMICYQWYKKFDKNGEPKKNSSAAHAVVGYGVESGTWNKTVNENTDTYTKRIQIEARVMGDLSMNHIIPVATHYQSQLAKNVQNMRQIFPAEQAEKLCARNLQIIEEIAERTQIIEKGVEDLINARKVANKIESEREKAIAYHDTVAPKMEEIRYQIDKLELTVADELWTLHKYPELLFIR